MLSPDSGMSMILPAWRQGPLCELLLNCLSFPEQRHNIQFDTLLTCSSTLCFPGVFQARHCLDQSPHWAAVLPNPMLELHTLASRSAYAFCEPRDPIQIQPRFNNPTAGRACPVVSGQGVRAVAPHWLCSASCDCAAPHYESSTGGRRRVPVLPTREAAGFRSAGSLGAHRSHVGAGWSQHPLLSKSGSRPFLHP